MKALTRLVLGLAVAAVVGGVAHAQTFVMKFGTASVNDPQTAFMRLYKDELERRSNGRIKVDLYLQSQLGAIPRQIEGVQLGSIEAFIGPVDFFVGVDPRFGVFSAPFLFRDETHAQATVHDPELKKTIFGLAEPKGMIGIGTLNLGVDNYAARTPILSLDDFKGKKLRINGTALERSKMSKLGATGVAMALSEVAPALSQGTIDGTKSIMSVFVSFKMNDLVKTVTVTNDSMVVAMAIVSRSWFNKLPPDLKAAVVESGAAIQLEVERQTAEFSRKQDADWVRLGGKVLMLPPAELAAMRTLLSGVGDEVTKDQPAVHAMLETVRAAAAKY